MLKAFKKKAAETNKKKEKNTLEKIYSKTRKKFKEEAARRS